MDLGANGISIGATARRTCIPASVAWINFFTEDPRAAEIYQSDNGVVAIDTVRRGADEQSAERRAPQERIIEFFSRSRPTAKPVAWPAGGYARASPTPCTAPMTRWRSSR